MDEQQRRQRRNEQLLASAVKFLIDGGEKEAATILLSCTLKCHEVLVKDEAWNTLEERWDITLAAPRVSYDVLTPLNDGINYNNAEPLSELPQNFHICASISNAFSALMGTNIDVSVKASFVTINDQWRQELLSLLRGDVVTNQGLQFWLSRNSRDEPHAVVA